MTGCEPLRTITAQEIDAFERDGFAVLPNVLSPAWLAPLDAACTRLLAAAETLDITDETLRATPPAAPSQLFGAKSYAATLARRGHFFMNFNTAQRERAVLEFALRGAVGAIAAALMRSTTARFVDDILFVKEPNTGEQTEWHDDDAGSATSGMQRCSLWISLGDVNEAGGPLRFLRASHRRFAGWRERGLRAASLVDDNPDDLIVCPVQVGDVVAHHLLTVHGACPNQSTATRRAWALRFAGDDARFLLRAARHEPRAWYGLEDGAPLTGPRFPTAWPPPDPDAHDAFSRALS